MKFRILYFGIIAFILIITNLFAQEKSKNILYQGVIIVKDSSNRKVGNTKIEKAPIFAPQSNGGQTQSGQILNTTPLKDGGTTNINKASQNYIKKDGGITNSKKIEEFIPSKNGGATNIQKANENIPSSNDGSTESKEVPKGKISPDGGATQSQQALGKINDVKNNLAGPNLTPYQPSGWSDKIVVSDVTGTTTDAVTIYNDENIYVDWAVINNGSSATSSRFYTALFIDGTEVARWYSDPPLNPNYYSYVTDYNIGNLSAGSHTFQIVADVTNTIPESNESDNSYSKSTSITVRSSLPNLTPYQPTGWSDKIVVSDVTGTTTDEATIYNDENIYVDWAVINNGSVATSSRFYTALLIDGTEATRWYSDPPLNPNNYSYITDYNIGNLSAGSHTFQIVADVTNTITESNESDNSYSKTKSISARSSLPNLTPYQPTGWSDKIVVSDVTGTTTDAATIYNDENIYVDWAVINNGSAATSSRFYTALLIDGTEATRWYSDPPLNPNNYSYITDYNIGKLTAGSHTFQIVADVTNTITESNESDNSYSKTKSISARSSLPNLTPYQPTGWSDKIVVSDVTGTTTDAATIYNDENIYVDWAVINNGSVATSSRFYTALLIDGTEATRWYSDPPLNPNNYSYITDYNIGKLTAGSHTFQIVADVTNTIPESNESDNSYSKTTSITTRSSLPNLTPYQPTGWSDKIVVSDVTGTTTDAATIYNDENIYVDWAVINNGSVATSSRFYTALLIDSTEVTRWFSDPPLNPNNYSYVTDYNIGRLAAGSHTFQIVADVTNTITESNKSDNSYSKTKSISARSSLPNLTPYQPTGWSDKIVVSDVTGTTTDAATIYNDENIYVDWAVINNGSAATSSRFYTALVIDSTEAARWYSDPPLNSNYYSYVTDYNIGKLSAGSHTFQIVADVTNVIPESNESDNSYSKTRSILQHGNPNISVTPVSITINQPGTGAKPTNWISYVPSKNNMQNENNEKHTLGLVIPDSVVKYWQTHTVQRNYNEKELLSTIDWSVNDSPVKDQKSCGSCWAFASVALVENIGKQSDLSEQVLISCSNSGNCDGGNYFPALGYIQNTGIPPEACYNYLSANGNCADKCSQPSFIEKITTYSSSGLWGEPAVVNDMKAALQNGPIVVSMNVYTDFYSYSAGTIYHHTSGTYDGRHAILLVGYNDDQQCFKVKNSWGLNWGENGYFRISYSDVNNEVDFGSYGVSASGAYVVGQNNVFTIQNTGGANLSISSINVNKNWLTTTGYSSTPLNLTPGGSQQISVNINWTQVQGNSDNGTITITSNDPANPQVTISVIVNKNAATILSVSPDTRNVTSNNGSTTFAVANSGTGTMNWTASAADSSSWLSISSGSSGTNAGTITASYLANNSSVPRTGTITITAAGASGSPKTVNVIQAGIVPPPSVTWQANISVSDNCSETGTLTFGEAPGATDGIDSSLGESELPPVPPTGTFDSRFILPITPSVASLKDFRSNAQTQATWYLTFQPGSCGYPINFSWNSAGLPAGNFNLMDEITGSIVNINMKTQNSYSLTNSGISSLKIVYSQSLSKDITVQNGWNIISIPLLAPDMSVTGLFSDAASLAFKYNNGYQSVTSVTNGLGYWIKFNTARTYSIIGSVISSRTINVNAGWNVIGPFENDISITSITTVPAGIIASSFYGFNNGYTSATTLQGGKGYWVKTISSGTFTLLSGPSKAGNSYANEDQSIDKTWINIKFTDALNRDKILYLSDKVINNNYELPPTPPGGIFDVRFSDNKFVENPSSAGKQIQINSAEYPIKLSINNLNHRSAKILDLFGGSIFNRTFNDGDEALIDKKIENLNIQIVEVPYSYELNQNYPNPFNPSTIIKFSLPAASRVKLVLYDILGNELGNIVDKNFEAGVHQVEFDASKYSSGVYFYRFQAGNFSDIKKMIILK